MTEPTSVQPKHTHYVSLENGCIHPALTSPAGYEDEHTTEWRPATAAEIQRYESTGGQARTEAYTPVPLTADAARTAEATPSSLVLSDEAPAALGTELAPPPPSGVQEAPLAAPVPPAPIAPPTPPFRPEG